MGQSRLADLERGAVRVAQDHGRDQRRPFLYLVHQLTSPWSTSFHQTLVRPLQLPCGAHHAWVQHTITLDPLPYPCFIQSHALHTTQIMTATTVLLKLPSHLVSCRRFCKKINKLTIATTSSL